jgi:hypothetical protein
MSLEIDWKDKQSSDINYLSVENDSELKTLIVDYIGEKCKPENGEVNVFMVADVMAKEFPEFVLCIAEENWLRGYEQGLEDTRVLGEE